MVIYICLFVYIQSEFNTKKKNFNFFNRKKIASEFNFIKEIKIKKIYPDTLNIILQENEPIAILIENNKKILLLEMGNTVSNYHVDIINSLPTVSGMNAKKNFYNFYKTLKKVNFDTELIEEFKYFSIDRWDIILKSGKIIKLPTERFESSIEKFISIYDKDNFTNFRIFDFRINGQLILK